MKQILEPIEVRDEETSGWKFRWRQRVYLVTRVSERWFYRGKWWLDGQLQGERRNYFRVICRQVQNRDLGAERVMELFSRCRPQGRDWVLSKVVD